MIDKLLQFAKKIYQKGLVHILAGSFMTKLVSFFGSIFLVRVLSKEDYGILGYLDNLYGYVFVLAGMGVSNAVLRYVVLGKTPEEKYGFFRYAYRRGILWNILLGIGAVVVFGFYTHPADYRDYVWLLNILLLALPFHYLTDNVLCNERAMFDNQRYATFSFALSTSIILSKIAAGFLGGIHVVVFAQAGVYVVLAVAMMILTKKKHYSAAVPTELSPAQKRTINSYSLQYMITNGLWHIFMLNDTFLLGRFCDPSALADYKVAYTLPGCVSIISSAIGVFVVPYFVRNENDPKWIRSNFKKTYVLSAAIAGCICLGIGVLAKPLIWLLYGEQYMNIVPVMRMLLLSAFFNCGMRYTTANLLSAMGRVRPNMVVSCLGMVLQVGINLFVVPVYGAMGVAMTSCVVYLFMAVTLLVVFYKTYFVDK